MKIYIFLLGTIIGSFLNVGIYRLPRGESIVFPSSHCPHCNNPLRPLDLVPILSFLALRGKCRSCSEKISPRYLGVEVLTGFMFLLAWSYLPQGPEFIYSIFLISSLIVTSFVDLEHGIIPDELTIPLMGVGLIFRFFFPPYKFLDSLLGLLLGGGIILLIVIISRGGMGGGDIKLFAMVGAFLGVKKTILALLLSFIFGGLIGAFLLATRLKGMKDAIPFGPFIALGTIISLYFSDFIIPWYLGFFF